MIAILVPLDGSRLAKRALPFAAKIATSGQATSTSGAGESLV